MTFFPGNEHDESDDEVKFGGFRHQSRLVVVQDTVKKGFQISMSKAFFGPKTGFFFFSENRTFPK